MTYEAAYEYAREKSTLTRHPYGIERNRYVAGGFTTFMLPIRPDQRFGHELRCQVVEPDSPRVERVK
jgi:hypothetical protein